MTTPDLTARDKAKRFAGVVNIVGAVLFLAAGVRATPVNRLYIVIGVVFAFIGYVRLRRRPVPPSAP